MAQRIGKNNKRKNGVSFGYHATFFLEKTEEAVIPVFQSDGKIHFVTPDDFKWLIENRTDPIDVSPSEDLK